MFIIMNMILETHFSDYFQTLKTHFFRFFNILLNQAVIILDVLEFLENFMIWPKTIALTQIQKLNQL